MVVRSSYDHIVLDFPKGKILPKIEIKYFKNIFPEPPLPPRPNEVKKIMLRE